MTRCSSTPVIPSIRRKKCVKPRGLSGKESACQDRSRGLDPWVGKMPWRRKWQPTPGSLSGKSYRQRNLATVHGVAKSGHNRATKQKAKVELISLVISAFGYTVQMPLTVLQGIVPPAVRRIRIEISLTWDFSGGPEVRTSSSQCRGHRFDPWPGN